MFLNKENTGLGSVVLGDGRRVKAPASSLSSYVREERDDELTEWSPRSRCGPHHRDYLQYQLYSPRRRQHIHNPPHPPLLPSRTANRAARDPAGINNRPFPLPTHRAPNKVIVTHKKKSFAAGAAYRPARSVPHQPRLQLLVPSPAPPLLPHLRPLLLLPAPAWRSYASPCWSVCW